MNIYLHIGGGGGKGKGKGEEGRKQDKERHNLLKYYFQTERKQTSQEIY